MKVKVVGIEYESKQAVKVKLEGSSDTIYTNNFYLYLPLTANIPAFGAEFELVPVSTPMSAHFEAFPDLPEAAL